MIDYKTADAIVDLLNELMKLDKVAIAALMANRVPCSEALADHATVQVHSRQGVYSVGTLGILNGLCGTDKNRRGAICAIFEGDEQPCEWGTLIGFKVIR